MRPRFSFPAFALTLALLVPATALAQADNTTNPSGSQRVQGTGDPTRGDPVNVRMVVCSAGSCASAGASSSDASAANQTSQITQATLTNTRLGDVTTPAAGSVNAQLGALVTASASARQTVGNVASGATDSGNPVKVGGIYNTTLPTLTVGQRGDMQLDANGSLRVRTTAGSATGTDATSNTNILTTLLTNAITNGINLAPAANYLFNGVSWDRQRGDTAGTVTQPYAITTARWQFAGASGGLVNTTAAATIAAAGGASVRNYLTGLQLSAGTLGAATELAVRDGVAGTVLWRGFIPTTGTQQSITFPAPLKGTANTLMEVVTLTATVTGGVYVNAQGYTAP